MDTRLDLTESCMFLMSEFQFGLNSEGIREFKPNYGGVDWHDAWVNRHGENQPSAWGETFDELGEFCEQLTQSNCCFYLNDTDPTFDIAIVIDHRDEGGDFWFTREQLGSDRYDELIETIGDEVMVVYTKYPAQHVAEFVIHTMMTDL